MNLSTGKTVTSQKICTPPVWNTLKQGKVI